MREFLKKYRNELEEIRIKAEHVYNREAMIETIENDADELESVLSELDFEETDWDRWTPTREYVPDYEIAQMLAEDDANEAFESYSTDFEASLLNDDLTDIVKEFSAIVHGVLTSEINDPDNNLGDPPNEFFISMIRELIVKNIPAFNKRVFLARDYQNSFDLIFAFNQKHYQGEHEFLRVISDFLIQVIGDNQAASMAWTAIKQYDTQMKRVPKLLSHITSLLGDKGLWIESLESTFLADYDTSIELLDYYHQTDNNRFEEKAPLLAERYEYWATDYLIDKVKKGTALHLFLLKKKVSAGGDYLYFQELKQFIGADELKQYVASIKNINIKVNLYGKEGMYVELEKLIRSELQTYSYYTSLDFGEAVKYLYQVNPDVAWELTTSVITKKMNSDKNRNTYIYLSKLLKNSLSIAGKSNEVKSYVNQFYNHKPNLPALKDEFRKAGLV